MSLHFKPGLGVAKAKNGKSKSKLTLPAFVKANFQAKKANLSRVIWAAKIGKKANFVAISGNFKQF